MHQIFTLSSVSGDYLSGHPEGGHVAYLYHSHELADDAISQMENPDEWQIKEITDLSEWIEKCKTDGITRHLRVQSGRHDQHASAPQF